MCILSKIVHKALVAEPAKDFLPIVYSPKYYIATI